MLFDGDVMCRWLAYSGAPIYLEEALFKPDHSLIDQSVHAKATETTTNGDGFGVGWYGKREYPGVYKDIRPAWNDANLQALAAQIESPLFLAHVRATTGTPVQRTNCHPFQHRNWLFVHNGVINHFERLRRDLTMAIAPDLFSQISGTTDSELMFLLALSYGMAEDVEGGLARMAGLVESVAAQRGIDDALEMTLGISDGESLFAVRYSSSGEQRSLFHSASVAAVHELAPEQKRFSSDARAIVSEPLSDLEGAWVEVPASSFLHIHQGDISCRPFQPIFE